MHVSLAVNIFTKCMPGKSASMHCITGCQLRVFMTFAASQMMTAAYDVYHARSCATWAMSVCLPCVSCLQLRCMGHAYNVYHACSCAAWDMPTMFLMPAVALPRTCLQCVLCLQLRCMGHACTWLECWVRSMMGLVLTCESTILPPIDGLASAIQADPQGEHVHTWLPMGISSSCLEVSS